LQGDNGGVGSTTTPFFLEEGRTARKSPAIQASAYTRKTVPKYQMTKSQRQIVDALRAVIDYRTYAIALESLYCLVAIG
jgi:hypothetical protein